MRIDTWPDRFHALDVSRCLASFSVILWHWKHFAYEGNSLSNDFVWTDQPLFGVFKMFYWKGWEGVSYFFILSGFIFFWLYKDSIKEKQTNVIKFFILRFSRLYPLHFATLIIVTLLQLLYIFHEDISFVYRYNDMYHFILNLGFASHWGFELGDSFNGPVWSVSIEVLLYAFFFVIAFLQRGSLFFSMSVSAFSLILFKVTGYKFFNGLSLFFWGGTVYYFTYAMSMNYQIFKFPVYLLTATAWLAVIVNFYVIDISYVIDGYGIVSNFFLRIFTGYLLFPATICCLALIEIDRGSFLKPISWVGDLTYSSYLLHFPLQLIFALLVSYGFLNADFYLSPIYFTFFFMLLIPSSYFTYRMFEIPLQKVLRDKLLFYKKESI